LSQTRSTKILIYFPGGPPSCKASGNAEKRRRCPHFAVGIDCVVVGAQTDKRTGSKTTCSHHGDQPLVAFFVRARSFVAICSHGMIRSNRQHKQA